MGLVKGKAPVLLVPWVVKVWERELGGVGGYWENGIDFRRGKRMGQGEKGGER